MIDCNSSSPSDLKGAHACRHGAGAYRGWGKRGFYFFLNLFSILFHFKNSNATKNKQQKMLHQEGNVLSTEAALLCCTDTDSCCSKYWWELVSTVTNCKCCPRVLRNWMVLGLQTPDISIVTGVSVRPGSRSEYLLFKIYFYFCFY